MRAVRLAFAAFLTLAAQAAFAFDAAPLVREVIPQAHVQGEGTLRLYGLRIYDARLYVGPTNLASNEMTVRPFALDIEYARAFKGASIAKKGREQMDDLALASRAQTAQWQKDMEGMFPDVQAGDHIVGVFMPESGTTFYSNEKKLGSIPGEAFARAFFSIWFDPRTGAPGLRQALLSGGSAN